ncbi:MAG: tetratricopeptide repeat protein, partial [Magnetospirillum sp.]|nr:tetratricopeptide repeat protein [Magnetospirillum sp.]
DFPKLMEHLAGHPLAMRLTLPRLDHHKAANLLADLRGEGKAEAAEGGGHLDSLSACIAYSFRHLSPEHRRLLPALVLCEGVAFSGVLTAFSDQAEVPDRFRIGEGENWAKCLDAAAALGLLTPLEMGMYRIHPALPAALATEWRRTCDDYVGDHAAAMDAMATAYAGFGSWLLAQIQSGDAEIAFALLASQRRSLGRSLNHALQRQFWEKAQAILQPLNQFWNASGLNTEARGWSDRLYTAVESPSGAPPDLDTDAGALWLFVRGSDASRVYRAGDLDTAESIYDNIRSRLERLPSESAKPLLSVAYHQLGTVAQRRGDLDAAENWCRQTLTIEEELGNKPGMASSYHQLGIIAQRRDDLETAENWYRQSLAIKEELGKRLGMASTYHQLGIIAQMRNDLTAAENWYRQSLAIEEELGNRLGMANSYHHRGLVAQDRGDLAAAENWYRQSLAIKEELGNRPGLALTSGQLGLLALQQGDSATALEWIVRANALFPDFPSPNTGNSPRQLALVTLRLGWPALEQAWQRITGNDLPEQVRLALPPLMEQVKAMLQPADVP